MILPIYVYNHPILRHKADEVEDLSDETVQFIENMFETMRHANGIGLAANQVGSPLAINVVDISDLEEGAGTRPMTLINPVIESFSDDEVEHEEGCLSLPDMRDVVVRPAAIQVRFLDEKLREQKLEADGLLARVIQHEVDHLNGVYFYERLSPVKRALNKAKLRRIERGQIVPDYDVVRAGE